jgi:chromosome segregation ATPase
MLENFKKDINNSLKEIQENTGKQVKAFIEETQKSLKELEENTNKKVKELNKTIQDLKKEIETIKKSQREITLEIENLGKRTGVIYTSITNRVQKIEERISSAEDTIENSGTRVKENAKCKKLLTQNIQEIKDSMRRPNLRKIGIEKREDSQLKGPVNIFNKIIEENFPKLKKEMCKQTKLHILITKITGSNNHFSLLSLNINELNSTIKRHRLTDWICKQESAFFCIQEMHLSDKDRHYLRVKGWKTFFLANGPKKQAEVAILISIKLTLNQKLSKKIKMDTSYWLKEKSTKMNSQF